MFRTAAKSHEPGRIFPYRPASNSEMLQDRGTIYLFDVKTHAVSVLRGHAGRLLKMAFAPAYPNKPPLLVSAAEEPDGRAAGKSIGRVCVWDVSKASAVNEKGELVEHGALVDEWTLNEQPRQEIGLAVRHTGEELRRLHVAIAWSDGKLRIWDVQQRGPASIHEAADGLSKWNNSVVHLQASEFLTAGTLKTGAGYLRSWNDAGNDGPERGRDMPLPPPDGFQGLFPRALGLLSVRRAMPRWPPASTSKGPRSRSLLFCSPTWQGIGWCPPSLFGMARSIPFWRPFREENIWPSRALRITRSGFTPSRICCAIRTSRNGCEARGSRCASSPSPRRIRISDCF